MKQSQTQGTTMKMTSIVLTALLSTTAFSAGLTRDELVSKYPTLNDGSDRTENTEIRCPFHRVLARAGIYDKEQANGGAIYATVMKIATAAKDFGCQVVGCVGVTSAVSGAQLTGRSTYPGYVNLSALHKAGGFSHSCGFALKNNQVSDEQRDLTLSLLADRADAAGHVTFDAISAVRSEICAPESSSFTKLAVDVESKLLYSFLGGKSRGFVDVSDVERFLHGELPKTIGAPETN